MDMLNEVAVYLVASPLAVLVLAVGLLAAHSRRAVGEARIRERLQPPR